MYDKMSLYALNKRNSKTIVYSSVTGEQFSLVPSQFPNEQEFLHWKKWLDDSFHAEENGNHVEKNHTTAVEDMGEVLVTPGADVALVEQELRQEYLTATHKQVQEIRELVTEKQFRRLWMYHVEKKTEQQIAVFEGVTQQAISKSLKELKKFF